MKIKFKKIQRESRFSNRPAYDGEVEMTDAIWKVLYERLGDNYIVEEDDETCDRIYITKIDTDECFTIKITQDE